MMYILPVCMFLSCLLHCFMKLIYQNIIKFNSQI
uniref:Uncharacterized protein n=1 Tax=Arundo donax TaxID=35708 RepID=A0A0A9HBL3_ARUDO